MTGLKDDMEGRLEEGDPLICLACDGDLPLTGTTPESKPVGSMPSRPEEQLPPGYDPVLAATVDALSKGRIPHQLMLVLGGITVTGRVVTVETWLEQSSGSEPMLASVWPQSPQVGGWANRRSRDRLTFLRQKLRWGMGLNEAQLAELRAADSTEMRRGWTPLSRARLTYLGERLRWGMGLTEEETAELRALEAAENRPGRFVHMVDVTIVSGGRSMSVPHWRGRLDRVDGFSIFKLAEDQRYDT